MGEVILEHITKEYSDVVAVNDMNLEIEDGEFVTLVGPSGCGKSTTLKTMAGLVQPTEGEVRIADEEVTHKPPKDRDIAMVFQNIALFPHMDVYDNISYGLRIKDHSKEEIDEKVNRAAEILQIDSLLDRMPDELSGGQRQRVAIGRALVLEPEAFLMDEPLANLDAKLRVHMRTELQRLHKELDTTIIYVTHDQAEAMTMSDRIAIINNGTLQQIAPPLECYNQPANRFVASFIGSPSMNLLDGTVTESGLETSDFTIDFDPSVLGSVDVGQQITIGIRPEDIYFTQNADSVDHPSREFTCYTDVLEPMGNEIFTYLRTESDWEESPTGSSDGNRDFLMSAEPDADIDVDDQVQITFDREKIHLFDANSGEALKHGIVRQDNVEIDNTVNR